jgi:hypothetical protein
LRMTQRDCGSTPAGLQSAIDSVQAVLSSIELEIPAAFQARRARCCSTDACASSLLTLRARACAQRIGRSMACSTRSTRARARERSSAARRAALAARARRVSSGSFARQLRGIPLPAAAPEECEEEVSGLLRPCRVEAA